MKAVAESTRAEFERRVRIAKELRTHLEQLLFFISQPLDDPQNESLASTRLALWRIADKIKSDATLLDRGEPIEMKGQNIPRERFVGFLIGTQRFCSYFEEMETGLLNWGSSKWAFNKKYASKFQSANIELVSFIVSARAVLTDRTYGECQREIAMESLLPAAPVLVAATVNCEIPEEHRTDSMTIKERAAEYFRNVDWTADHKAKVLRQMMDNREIRFEQISPPNGRRWYFDKREG